MELERGEVVELNRPGIRHGVVCGNVTWLLGTFVRQQRAGCVVSNDAGLIVGRDPDTVYRPDVFLYAGTIQYEDLERRGSAQPPMLVVEVLSPPDRYSRIMRHVEHYLEMGAPLVWVIDPESLNVTVRRPGERPGILETGDELTGFDSLADLRIAVADLFRLPE